MGASQIVHWVVAFRQIGRDAFAELPERMPSAAAAVARAKALTLTHVGVIAWSRSVVPETGDYGDPVVLVRLGTIPDWFDATGDAGV